MSAGLSTDMAQNAKNAMAAAASALGNKHESATSQTQSAIGSNIQIDTETPENLTALSRDTQNANHKVKAFDHNEVKEQQEAAQVAGELFAKVTGDLAKKFEFEDGSKEKIAMHALAGALAAKMSDGNVATGAAAGAGSEWLNTYVTDYLNEQAKDLKLDAGQKEKLKQAAQQMTALVIGAAAGAVTGGSSETMKQGALTSYNAETYNRQLHVDEIKWIKENAKRFAQEESERLGHQVTEQEAMERLITQAAQEVDYAWFKKIGEIDGQAQSFLRGVTAQGDVPPYDNRGTFINSDGKRQSMFTVMDKDEYYSTGKYSNALAQFDKANGHVVTNTLQPKVKYNLYTKSLSDGADAADRAYKANPSKENEAALNTANQNLITANNEADKWQTGGEYKRKIDGAMNAISAALGGLPAAGIATSAISPEINHQIKLATEGSPMANKVAHAVWGAVEAYSANQNAAAGAGGALAGEVMADVIAKELYGKKPNQLNREEKEVVSSVSQAAGALVGGAAANSSQGIGVGLTTAKNAVENNLLSKNEDEELFNISEKFEKAKELKQKEKNRGGELLKKDSYINFLIRLNQKDPSQLTEAQKNYLAVELHKIARSWNVPVSDLYNWDFSKEIKRNDSALTKYLSDEIKFWDSYVGKQAQSFAIGALAAGGGVAAVRVIPKAAGYLQETAVLSARNPVAAEMVVTGGYNAGKISYKTYDGQYKNKEELLNDIYSTGKDILKAPVMSKLGPVEQFFVSPAVDLMYEVNKVGATDKQIKTEMIGSATGAGYGLLSEFTLGKYSKFDGVPRIFFNVVGSSIASDEMKKIYSDSSNEKEGSK